MLNHGDTYDLKWCFEILKYLCLRIVSVLLALIGLALFKDLPLKLEIHCIVIFWAG